MDSVQVEIFGRFYSLKGREDAAYIRELAAFVDSKMNEVQKGTGTADPLRVAILASLTISDELNRLRRQHNDLEQLVEQKMKRLIDVSNPASKISYGPEE